ncbi:hypothetical protein ACFE04_028024 [Oxalis oulophora]
MSNIPGLFDDIGKDARDLLYKDYTRHSAAPLTLPRLSWRFDVACKGSVPGLNTAFKLTIPDFSKVELQYMNEFIGITAGIGTKTNDFQRVEPFLNFSAVLGVSLLSIGADVELDITERSLNEFHAGMKLTTSFLTASVTTNEKLDTLRASLFHAINPLSRTAIAAEVEHKFTSDSSKYTTLSFGAQHGLLPWTLLKARVNTEGLVGTVVQQELWHKFYLAIAGEVDYNQSTLAPKIGFSMSLRP